MNIEAKEFCAKANQAARLLKCLANAYRLMILCRLHEGECSVGTLEKLLDLNQSALSQHLARLRKDGIVATRRESQTIYYRVADAQASQIVKQLYSLYCRPTAPTQAKRKKAL